MPKSQKSETKSDVVVLSTFKFDVAIVEVISSQSPSQKSTINIIKHSHQAEFFTENLPGNIILEMVSIPGGQFIMGSPKTDEESTDDERPQHEVSVQPFFMGKYPVTQAQWRAVAKLPQVNCELNPDPSDFKEDNLPVESISWDEAIEFCDRTSKYTGKKYRLPSEAEWEFACRGGTTTPFHFGEKITAELANHDGECIYASRTNRVDRNKTTPVGGFEVANAFGLYDMHGNVWEWCADDWHSNYGNAPNNGNAWIINNVDDNDKQFKILRGGSWVNYPEFCRSASRGSSNLSDFCYNVGFRVVFASVASTLLYQS
ncbi:MAG: formylglycine-generating enzyme family protein [Scytonematopsis contorta HA4267-MV1]|jgi:formylglycine-generating enzyme required for sulfatase activity|nr:formylglycine-generating enzyme family protein [Scytonematopsis contorta HA4267-MV1]